jgi:hypothetical protein
MSKYRYKIISTMGNSAQFGNCQVCKTHASEVFHQIEEHNFGQDEEKWTHAGCFDYFGHKECLQNKQRA